VDSPGASLAAPAAISGTPAREVTAACDSAAARWAQMPGATVQRSDTLLTGRDILPDMAGDSMVAIADSVQYSACHVAGTHAAGLDQPAIGRLYWPAAGWGNLHRLIADGPDGGVRTFQKGWVRCQVSEEWDGGDDSDSTYVPDPFYRERTLCWHHSRLIVPDDTAPARW
jgi:hypothetical protein